jgi:hypothetical protein
MIPSSGIAAAISCDLREHPAVSDISSANTSPPCRIHQKLLTSLTISFSLSLLGHRFGLSAKDVNGKGRNLKAIREHFCKGQCNIAPSECPVMKTGFSSDP